MNLKLVSVSLLALAVASTLVLAGCKPKEETTDVNVTTEEAVPTVMEEEAAPAEEGAMTEEAAPATEGAATTEEHAAGEHHAEEAAH